MKKLLKDLTLNGKRVLVRVDYNVPLKDGQISDDTRIRETVPTLRYLLEQNAKIILITHLGRPKGKSDPKYSVKPVAEVLSKLLGKSVKFIPDCVGGEVKKAVETLKSGEILLLENLRFHKEEEANAEDFAKELASVGDVFVQEAFGAVHRAHASTVGITKFLPSAGGFLLEKEVQHLGKIVANPDHPFLAVLGGAKVSDKIGVIENLIGMVDAFIIGGAMAYTFLKAQGHEIGNSLFDQATFEQAKELLKLIQSKGIRCHLPVDHVVAKAIEPTSPMQTTSNAEIPAGWIGVDIGPKTLELYNAEIAKAKTIFWNGPMGVFEMEAFAKGTISLAATVAKATAKGTVSVIGGGDSVAAVKKAGVAKNITHISTGGGASLEFLEGKILPGLAALADK